MFTTIHRRALIAGLAIAAVLPLAAPRPAEALEDKLVIVTSYPPDTTVTVKKAFEARQGKVGVKVEAL